jgi:hypothetical protein
MEASLLPHFDPNVCKTKFTRMPQMWLSQLATFHKESTRCLDGMELAIRANAHGSWLGKAHDLERAALHIGARKLGGLCAEARTIRNMRDDSAKALLYHLQKECAFLRTNVS